MAPASANSGPMNEPRARCMPRGRNAPISQKWPISPPSTIPNGWRNSQKPTSAPMILPITFIGARSAARPVRSHAQTRRQKSTGRCSGREVRWRTGMRTRILAARITRRCAQATMRADRGVLPVPTVLLQSNLAGLDLVHRGKVRDVYALSERELLIVATDRLSAFDVVLPDPIPGQGRDAVPDLEFLVRQDRAPRCRTT